MGTRADFYIDRDEKLEWIGSIYKDGAPCNIPTDILIQVNPVMFEELTVEFLESQDSVIRKNGDAWPWPWEDSRMTDYSYIFMNDKVYAFAPQSIDDHLLFDPLKVVQGESANDSKVAFACQFPRMIKQSLIIPEEISEHYGFKSTQTV